VIGTDRCFPMWFGLRVSSHAVTARGAAFTDLAQEQSVVVAHEQLPLNTRDRGVSLQDGHAAASCSLSPAKRVGLWHRPLRWHRNAWIHLLPNEAGSPVKYDSGVKRAATRRKSGIPAQRPLARASPVAAVRLPVKTDSWLRTATRYTARRVW